MGVFKDCHQKLCVILFCVRKTSSPESQSGINGIMNILATKLLGRILFGKLIFKPLDKIEAKKLLKETTLHS